MDNKIDIKTELNSDEYKREVQRLVTTRESLFHCLLFCLMNASRDGVSHKDNFFLRMIDDIIQSSTSIELLAREGVTNTCKRELRYLLEVSIKSCFIVNSFSGKTFELQIEEYNKLLDSSNINPINTLKLGYLKDGVDKLFLTDVKKMYGYLSNYTHSTSYQITERLNRVQNGRSIGYEGISELKDLNDSIERVFSYVLVFIFHSVAQYVVGDYLVESNGDSINWHFNQSKYINIIDGEFDYKHERKSKLNELKQKREKYTKF